jgi:maltooligosyltrehalose trehalohydrolase
MRIYRSNIRRGREMRFEVWAPTAGRVELVVDDGRRLPMAPMASGEPRAGWWWVDAEGVTDYSFSLDGGEPRPDPRSRSQPYGVHGPSRVVDDASFAWTDQGWRGFHLPSAVLYELHVGTFSPEGTFDGAIAHLDHLVELGVDAVEVLPIAQFPGRHGWGYDGVDLYAAHDAYGGPDGFKRFVDACHGRGLGVVVDVVYNHLGPAGNHLGEFGPYFTDRYETPWGQAVNLDGPDSHEVRAFFVDNALMWLRDHHCDGLRLDAVHALFDSSPTHFLAEVTTEVERMAAHLGRPLWVTAENEHNQPEVVAAREAGGHGVHAVWADDFHHALHVRLTGERQGYYAPYDADDLRRARPYVDQEAPALPGWRFVVCAQNHDQVGNRATGDRLSHLVGTDAAMAAAAALLTSPFVPLLFAGEEWAASTPFQYFTDHDDADLGRAVSEGRRREFAAFGWAPDEVPDPQDPATYERSKLDWSELARSPHAEVLEWYRRLIAMRREMAALTDGDIAGWEVEIDADDRTVRVRRGDLHLVLDPKVS